jgi:hypothetical protein
MFKGRIKIEKLNLLGYTPANQAFVISNGGGDETCEPGASTACFHFLAHISKWVDRTSFGYVIHAPRLEKFRAYVEANGFKVVEE